MIPKNIFLHQSWKRACAPAQMILMPRTHPLPKDKMIYPCYHVQPYSALYHPYPFSKGEDK
jgi:hypothetical protein